MKGIIKSGQQLHFNRIFRYTFKALIFISLFGCDTFEEDSIIEAQQIDGKIDVVALSNNATIIDLKSYMTINGTVTIRITDEPKLGVIDYLAIDLLKYTPTKGIGEGKDKVAFSVSGGNQNLLFYDTLNIQILSGVADSCFFYAVQDQYSVPTDSIVFLNVMENDFICDSTATLTISNPPIFGNVEVIGTSLKYTSGIQENRDSLVYKVTGSDPSKTTYASVTIDVGNCIVQLQDDYQYYDLGIVELKFLVLSNDMLCNKTVTASVKEQPQFGTAVFDSDNFLSYFPDKDSTYTDSLVYEVCYTGGCKQARVFFDIIGSDCNTVQALDDTFNLADTTLTSFIFFDVLDNDTYCNDVALELLAVPVNGLASVENNQIKYLPDSSVVESDSFTYRLCSLSDTTQCDAGEVSIIGN